MNERLQKLTDQVKELQQWQLSNSVNQITFNQPVTTQKLMHAGHFEMQDSLTFLPNTAIALEVKIDDSVYYVPAFTQ